MQVTFDLPIRTRSVSNLREHWAVRAKRSKEERWLARIGLQQVLTGLADDRLRSWRRDYHTGGRIEILLVRVGPRPLDSDNLAISCKGVRDGIADAIGLDDGAPGLIWTYAQEKGKEYSVKVRITTGAVAGARKGGE